MHIPVANGFGFSLGFPQSSPVLSPPSPDLGLKVQSLLKVSPSVIFSLQSFQSFHKYLRITRVISLIKSWNRSVIWNFFVFGDTTIIGLAIFYDARDDVELTGFSNLQEASLHMSTFKMCVVKLRLYSFVYGTEKD